MSARFIAFFLGVSFSFMLAIPAQARVTSSTQAEPFVPLTDEFAAAIVMVPETHQVLYAFKPYHTRVAASLTKLANALAFVSLKPNLDHVVSLRSSDEVGGGRLRVKVGAQMSLRDLVYSSITASANNTATALARVSRLGSAGYIRRMNQETKKIGATRSIFVDASGMNPKNRTTAYDVALIAEQAFRQDLIQRAASIQQYEFSIRNTKQQKIIQNTNLLLQDEGVFVVGGKTGYLNESMYNLVVELKPIDATGSVLDQKGLIVVVLGAPTKQGSFAAAKRLAEWAWQNHQFHQQVARP